MADALQLATNVLFRLTGRQWPGVCTATVRPNARYRGDVAYGLRTGGAWSLGVGIGGTNWYDSWGYCDCNREHRTGCGSTPEITLGGYPVISIDEVKVDGAVLDPSRYRVDDYEFLLRLPDADGSNPGWPCFPAGTLVLTSTGLKPIETIEAGEEVLTHKNRWRRVTRAGKTGDSETVRLTGRGGTLRCTPDHQLWAREIAESDPHRSGTWNRENRKLGAPDWIEASQMLGRAWATPLRADPLPVVWPKGWEPTVSFWWMVGRWLGDGWTDRRGNRVTICCGKHEADELAEELAKTGRSWQRSEERTAVRFRLSDVSLRVWLREQFGVGAAGKRLPGWMFTAQSALREAFLAGYTSADGWLAHPEDRRPFMSVRTVSRDLAVGIRMLAAIDGRAPMLYEAPQRTQEIEGRPVSGQTAYRVDWPILSGPGGPWSQAWADEDHLFGRVREVELDEAIVPVYDLEVEEDHSFVADGFVVHNCCQRVDLPTTEAQTFAVAFKYGRTPEAGAKEMTASYACELAKAWDPLVDPSNCRLPNRVIQVSRQGVTMQMLDPSKVIEEGLVGLPEVDTWVRSINPNKLQRRARAWSPDVPKRVRRAGT